MEEQKRRGADYGIGKLIHYSPLIGSIIIFLVSVGEHISSLKQLGDREDKQEAIIASIQQTQNAQVGINSQLTEIIKEHERRVISIEDWRNGVNDVYVTHHRR